MTDTTSLTPTLYSEGCPDPQDLDRFCNILAVALNGRQSRFRLHKLPPKT
jgi:hypothetical protein